MTNLPESPRNVASTPATKLIYARFASAANKLRNADDLTSSPESQLIWDDIWHHEAHHSTALGGNSLVLSEVRTLLDENRAVGGKELGDYLEVLGLGEASRWVHSQTRRSDHSHLSDFVDIAEVRHLHQLVLRRTWEVAPHPQAFPEESPGSFRRHDFRPFSVGMVPPPWVQVPPLLHTWVDMANRLGASIASGATSSAEIPKALAELHASFERIRPFIDGNGRTGRLLLNLILVRLGFPPAIIHKSNADRYLNALDRADHGNPHPLAELIARSVIDNINRLIVPVIAEPATLVALTSLASPQLSYQALRQAAARGRLEATYASDGTWRASQSAVDAYLASKHKRTAPAQTLRL